MSPKLEPEARERRRARILAAALGCFARKGYAETTIDDVARAAGVSKGGIYSHFRSKREIFLSLADSLFRTTDLLAPPLGAGRGALEKLEALRDTIEGFSTSREFEDLVPLWMELCIRNRADPEVRAVVRHVYDRSHRHLVHLIEEGVARGELRRVDASSLARGLVALFDGLMVQSLLGPERRSWGPVLRAVIETVARGLALSGSPRRSRRRRRAGLRHSRRP